MEYIKYGDLSQYSTGNARVDAKEITTQVLEGLVVLHAEGICHRDLKPQVGNLPSPWTRLILTEHKL